MIEKREKNVRPTSHASRIGIFHQSLNGCGGADMLTLMLIDALHEYGHRVELITPERPDWRRIKAILGADPGSLDRVVVIPPFVTPPTIYKIFVYWLLRDAIFTPLMRRRYNLTITTISTLPVTFSDMLYMHFPEFTSAYLDRSSRKYSHGAMRAYSLPFRLASDLAIWAFTRMSRRTLLLTNSQYTRDQIRHDLNTGALVVYPGIDTYKYAPCRQHVGREDIVVTVSHFDEKKNLVVLPKLARSLPRAKFVLLGSTDSTSQAYIAHLMNEGRRMGVGDRILMLPNAPESQKIELFSKAKVYLHTMKGEHFGISIVEAMSAGLVPVVHKSGGPWIDILQRTQGVYGYGYEDVEEAASIITQILEHDGVRIDISRRAAQRALSFDSSIFKSSILEIVEQMLAARRSARLPS